MHAVNIFKQYFAENAYKLAATYSEFDVRKLHETWLNESFQFSRVLDIGCGSGRDALFFASLGAEVLAVDYSQEMLSLARQSDTSGRVTWLLDSAPELKYLPETVKYNLILLSAVLMFLSRDEQLKTVKRLAPLVDAGGLLVVTFKSDPNNNLLYSFDEQISGFLKNNGFVVEIKDGGKDALNRNAVTWTVLVAKRSVSFL